MSAQNMPPNRSAEQQDAIDVNDFVYAATGARVRRLTLPDGSHWFPAADVAGELGYANTRAALSQHVPDEFSMRLDELAQGVTGSDTLRKHAGHGLQRSMRMVNLQGLIRLVNGCTKPEAEPFKRWVTEVIVTIQRDGSYHLEKAEVQTSAAPAYAVPHQMADVLARLEERNLQLIEELAAVRREAAQGRTEVIEVLRDIADRLPSARSSEAPRPRVTAESVLSGWRSNNLVITNDIWAVGAYILPAIIERGEAGYPLDAIAARTGLSVHRVHDSLRMMQKRGCIRQTGMRGDGTPVYALK
ncbi:Bro-N domain-containing protein [Streptomyces luteireticuli]|uniref:BRO-N domain-containing protein n=1 Tax=Streptomyces luteireticuli TaxID=173858 RepID=UPI003557DEB9